MAIKYTLSIDNVTKKFSVGEFSDVIVNVNISVSAYSEEYPEFNYSCSGQISLSTDQLDSESFVDFSMVDKETVVGWLLSMNNVETLEEFPYVRASVENIKSRIEILQQEESVSTNWSVNESIDLQSSQNTTVLEA